MSEKIAVHCTTQELWDKVAKGSLGSSRWQEDGEETCFNPKLCMYSPRGYYLNKGYTIISAEEYLKEGENEVSEFKVGDRVECIDIGKEGEYKLEFGSINTITKVGIAHVYFDKNYTKTYREERFKLAANKPTTKTTKEETILTDEEYFEKYKDELCETCEDLYQCNGSHPDSLCEGKWCGEMIDTHKDDNPNEEEETMSKDNNVNSDVQTVFGEDVIGNELLVIDRHFTRDMLTRILMKKYAKDIRSACKDAETERLEKETQ